MRKQGAKRNNNNNKNNNNNHKVTRENKKVDKHKDGTSSRPEVSFSHVTLLILVKVWLVFVLVLGPFVECS